MHGLYGSHECVGCSLTFGEVYDAPQRDRVHREKQEDDCGDSASVASESSVVKTPYLCRRHMLILMQR